MDESTLNKAMSDALTKRYPEFTEFLDVAGNWAELMPEEAWAPGLPPKVKATDMWVAVKTQTGHILTGTLKSFVLCREGIARRPQYGPIVAWLPVGEPDMTVFDRRK